MSERSEREVDAALAALAREVGAETPRPGPGLELAVLLDAALSVMAREAAEVVPAPSAALSRVVMADAALATLAREVAETAPRPTADLVARVLADAAKVGQASSTAAGGPAAPPRRRFAGLVAAGPAWGGLVQVLFGWRTGAVACMLLGLALGLGLGFEVEPGALPVLDDPVAQSDALAFAGLDSGFDFVEGL